MSVHLTTLLHRSRYGLLAKVTTLPCLEDSSIRGTTPALSLTVAGNKSFPLLCCVSGSAVSTTQLLVIHHTTALSEDILDSRRQFSYSTIFPLVDIATKSADTLRYS